MGDAFRAGNNAADIMMEIAADMMMKITEDIDDRNNAEGICTAREDTPCPD